MSTFNRKKGNSLFGDQSAAGIQAPDLDATLKAEGSPDELPEMYSPPDNLGIPQEVRDTFEEQGFGLCWIRIYIQNGQLDVNNIRRSEEDGYVFVRKEEVPAMTASLDGYFSGEINKHKDIITVGDLALAKVRLAKRNARNKYYEDMNKSRSKALVEDLRHHSIGDPNRGDTFKSSWSKSRPVDFES